MEGVGRVVALLILGTALLPSGGMAQQPTGAQPLMVNLISRATAINNFVNFKRKSGDLYVFTDRLFPARSVRVPDTQIAIAPHIGTVDGRCILIDPSAWRFDCSFTSNFQDGDITLAGSLTLVEGSTSSFAVGGGTGKYRNAGGEATVKLGPPGGPHEVTIILSGTECTTSPQMCRLTSNP